MCEDETSALGLYLGQARLLDAMLVDSWQVQYTRTDMRKEWMCTSIFSKWEVTLTLSVDFWARTETLSLVVKDAETKEEAPTGVLLDEISDLAGIIFD